MDLIFEDQNQKYELNKFSVETQNLIKEYVSFSKHKILEEKRNEIVIEGESESISLGLLKQAFYEQLEQRNK